MTEMLQSIKSDLLSRRMLPLLAALSVALLAAAVYAFSAGGSSGPTSLSSPAPSTAVSPSGSSLAVTVAPANPHEAVAETPGGQRYQSQSPTRNPFTPLPEPRAKKTAASGANGSKGKGTGGSSTSTKTGSSSKGTTTGGSAPVPAPKPPAKVAPKPAHAGLSSTQSYDLALSLTSQGGNLDAIESLERLSGLPSEQQPLLVYLGVLEGGKDALFVVQPGTVVSGPGGCTPGPADCEILSLAPGQIESLAVSTSGGDSNVALFTVTAIKVDSHPSVAAASRARHQEAASGRALLKTSTLPSLTLFEYRPTVGAVVDLRDLAVGGEK